MLGRIVGMGKKVGAAGEAGQPSLLRKIGGGAIGIGRDALLWGVGMPMITNAIMGGGSAAPEAPPVPGVINTPDLYVGPQERRHLLENAYMQQMMGISTAAK